MYKEALIFYNIIDQNETDNKDILLMKGICEFELGNIDIAKKIVGSLKNAPIKSFRLQQFLLKLENQGII